MRTMTLSDGSHNSDNDTKIQKDSTFDNQDDHSMEFLKLDDVSIKDKNEIESMHRRRAMVFDTKLEVSNLSKDSGRD